MRGDEWIFFNTEFCTEQTPQLDALPLGHAAWRLPAQPPPIIPPLTRLIGGLHARHLTTGLEPSATTSHSLTHDGPLIRDTTVHERSHLRDLLGTTSKLTHTLTHSAPP